MFYSKLVITILNFFDFFQKIQIIKLFKKKFYKPIIVFDVGAHYGETIKLFLNKLNVKKIYSFEASPQNFKILNKNLKKFNNSKVKIFNIGLGAKATRLNINQTIESSSSTIQKLNLRSLYYKKKLKILNIKNNKKFFKKIPIKLITLDYFIKKNNIDYIDLLKIDTEGYEFNIIKGLKKYSNQVNIIYFEHHYDDMILKNYTFGNIHDLLVKKGFKMISKSKMLFRRSFEYIYENQNFKKTKN